MAVLTIAALGGATLGSMPATAATTAPPSKVCATPNFTDISSTTTFYAATTWLRCEGISAGYADGTFRPGQQITRGEVAALLFRYSGETHNPGTQRDFTDVSPSSSYFKATSWMKDKSITSGYSNGSYGVNNPITRGELSAFLLRYSGTSFSAPAVSPYTDMKQGDSFYAPATWLYSTKQIGGYKDGSFKPTREVTRGETAAFMYALEKHSTGIAPTYTVPASDSTPSPELCQVYSGGGWLSGPCTAPTPTAAPAPESTPTPETTTPSATPAPTPTPTPSPDPSTSEPTPTSSPTPTIPSPCKVYSGGGWLSGPCP